MNPKAGSAAVMGCVAALLLGSTEIASACTPYVYTPGFTYGRQPDPTLDRYVKGELGIIRPEFASSYLVVAYRYLAGLGMTEGEQTAARAVWRRRLGQGPPTSTDWRSRWLYPWQSPSSSASYRDGVLARYRVEHIDGTRLRYLNYTQDAYRHVAETLKWLESVHGVGSPAVAEWRAAQDMVFDNNDPSRPRIPAALPDASDWILREERRYQIAAAHFYAGHFDEAATRFEAMGEDPASPYRQMAPYLRARALIREGTLRPPERAWFDPEPLGQARVILEQLRAHGTGHALFGPSTELWYYVLWRLDTTKFFLECGRAVRDGDPVALFKRAFDDYTYCFSYRQRENLDRTPDLRRDNDMTDWIVTMAMADRDAHGHAVEKWRSSGSPAWLVAAMESASGEYGVLPELMAASAEVAPTAAAYYTLAFHRARVLREAGRDEEATAVCETATQAHRDLSRATRNQFLDIRMASAQTLDDYLRHSVRVRVENRRWPDEPTDRTPQLAYDAERVLNKRLPVAMLEQAGRNEHLPRYVRDSIEQCAWVRYVLLTALALRSSAEAYDIGPEQAAAYFSDILRILRHPVLQPFVGQRDRGQALSAIDSSRRNWWCSLDPGQTRSSRRASAPAAVVRPPYPDFVNAEARAQAEREREAIESLGPAPNFLCEEVIRWAEVHPDDPLIPEALHLAVRATRIGCTDENTSAYSKRAFGLLHSRYPKSDWAEKTPYHY